MEHELDYAFAMWVPQEALFGLLNRVAELDGSDELSRLIWPDGRRLDYSFSRKSISPRRNSDLIPFDSSLPGYSAFVLSLPFQANEDLSRYGEKKTSSIEWSWAHGIEMTVDIYYCQYRWLGEEPIPKWLSFRAANGAMSLLFKESKVVQQFFIDLARDFGAVRCSLDNYLTDDSKLLFARGIVAEAAAGRVDFEGGIPIIRPSVREDNAAAQKVDLCTDVFRTLTDDELIYVETLRYDQDPGVRDSAYFQIGERNKYNPTLKFMEHKFSLLEPGLQDSDWRVRARAVSAIGRLRLPDSRQLLSSAIEPMKKAFQDPQIGVKFAAVEHLSFKDVLEVFESTPLTPANFGLIKLSMQTLHRDPNGWNASASVMRRVAEPDFPFSGSAKYTIQVLQTRPDPPREASSAP